MVLPIVEATDVIVHKVRYSLLRHREVQQKEEKTETRATECEDSLSSTQVVVGAAETCRQLRRYSRSFGVTLTAALSKVC